MISSRDSLTLLEPRVDSTESIGHTFNQPTLALVDIGLEVKLALVHGASPVHLTILGQTQRVPEPGLDLLYPRQVLQFLYLWEVHLAPLFIEHVAHLRVVIIPYPQHPPVLCENQAMSFPAGDLENSGVLGVLRHILWRVDSSGSADKGQHYPVHSRETVQVSEDARQSGHHVSRSENALLVEHPSHFENAFH